VALPTFFNTEVGDSRLMTHAARLAHIADASWRPRPIGRPRVFLDPDDLKALPACTIGFPTSKQTKKTSSMAALARA